MLPRVDTALLQKLMVGRMPFPMQFTSIARLLSLVLVVTTLGFAGCASLWRTESDQEKDEERLRDLMKVPAAPDLIREAAVPRGMNSIRVDGVGVVNALPGTGGPADPSPMRDQLIEEMKRNDVSEPNQFLEMNDTALVRVKAVIPPGAKRGDPIDLLVNVPQRSNVSDLHGGWLLDTRMRHQQVLQSTVRKSDVMSMGTGAVLTRSDTEPGVDDALKRQGRVLAGGRVQTTRKIGLILRPDYQHVKMSADLAETINRRFFFFDGSTRRGIAKAIEDDYVEIEVHPRYERNVFRLMSVILSMSAKSQAMDSQQRLTDLAKRLKEPVTASDAALQLEAIGENAVPTLLEGLQSTNPELRFYAAEALAYLDRVEAIDPLVEAASSVAAFRHPALTALRGIPKHLAVEGLRKLFDEPSLESRYGSFVSIRRRDDGRRTLGGEYVGETFRMYQIDSSAPPAVVVSMVEQPEIVLFGKTGAINIQKFLFGPGGLILKPEPTNPNQIRISNFQAGEDDRRLVVNNSLPAIIRGINAVGGGYGDVVYVLRKLKEKGFLEDRLAIDPLPKSLRLYYREDATSDASEPPSDLTVPSASR